MKVEISVPVEQGPGLIAAASVLFLVDMIAWEYSVCFACCGIVPELIDLSREQSSSCRFIPTMEQDPQWSGCSLRLLFSVQSKCCLPVLLFHLASEQGQDPINTDRPVISPL